jgi:hypothetical protein
MPLRHVQALHRRPRRSGWLPQSLRDYALRVLGAASRFVHRANDALKLSAIALSAKHQVT